MGSPEFAVPSLEKLYASSHEIVAVVSNVDKRRGRGAGTSPTPVKAKALELELPVIEVEDLKDACFADSLRRCNADLFVVVAFRILPPGVLDIPTRGSVNLHASLLPKYRGAAPIHWAVMNGEEKTGCSIFFLNERVDTGNIILQEEVAIGPNETTGDVYDRLKTVGSDLLLRALNEIENSSYSTVEQDDREATPAPKLYPRDCRIDFQKSALEVHNKIRGLSPFPTAWSELDGLRFNMYRSRLGSTDSSLKPGQLALERDELLIGCGSGTVILDEVQLEGKRKMSGRDFINGYNGIGVAH
jgi:methionyl-tRNA formyltransferase